MSSTNLIYPHIIPLINYQTCDNCDNYENLDCRIIPYTKRLGWVHCNSNNCLNIVDEWQELTTADEKILKKQYGNKVKVIRTSGVLESDWEIYGSAYQTKKGTPFYITVRKLNTHTTKCIDENTFKTWQKA